MSLCRTHLFCMGAIFTWGNLTYQTSVSQLTAAMLPLTTMTQWAAQTLTSLCRRCRLSRLEWVSPSDNSGINQQTLWACLFNVVAQSYCVRTANALLKQQFEVVSWPRNYMLVLWKRPFSKVAYGEPKIWGDQILWLLASNSILFGAPLLKVQIDKTRKKFFCGACPSLSSPATPYPYVFQLILSLFLPATPLMNKPYPGTRQLPASNMAINNMSSMLSALEEENRYLGMMPPQWENPCFEKPKTCCQDCPSLRDPGQQNRF